MYIRRTQTRAKNSSDSYYTYRLVQSKRIGSKVKQMTLLNLGSNFDIRQDKWPELCIRIEQLLSGQPMLIDLPCSPKMERKAEQIAAQLLQKERIQAETHALSPAEPSEVLPPTDSPVPPLEADNTQYSSVDPDSLQLIQPRSAGVEQIALWAMEQVDFSGILREAGLNRSQQVAAIGSIIARMAKPGSEYATHHWLRHESALGELLDIDYQSMGLSQLYRTSDQLIRKQEIIESTLFSRLQNLFGFEHSITLYDLTNTYFEGEAGQNTKAKRGRSKEKRSDCPLLTLGLVVDGSGFVHRSQVFAGNASEGQTLSQMLQGLQAPFGALVIMDRGIATNDNIQWLKANHYRYLVVSRNGARQFDHEHSITITTASNKPLKLHKIHNEEQQEVELYCYSEDRAKKEESIQERFATKFEAGLKALHEGLSKPRTNKQLASIWMRIGRLKKSSRGASQHYHIEVTTDENNNNATAIHWRKEAKQGTQATHPGIYCLRSSEVEWDAEKLWKTYSTLSDLEAVFRSLKSELGLRPIYHQSEERADGHLFITVLAYQFVQLIRKKLAEHTIHDSWLHIRQTMERQRRITTIFTRQDGHTLHVRKASKAEADQATIYRALGVDQQAGGVKKIVI